MKKGNKVQKDAPEFLLRPPDKYLAVAIVLILASTIALIALFVSHRQGKIDDDFYNFRFVAYILLPMAAALLIACEYEYFELCDGVYTYRELFHKTRTVKASDVASVDIIRHTKIERGLKVEIVYTYEVIFFGSEKEILMSFHEHGSLLADTEDLRESLKYYEIVYRNLYSE